METSNTDKGIVCAMCGEPLDADGEPSCDCWVSCSDCGEWFDEDELDDNSICADCAYERDEDELEMDDEP